MNKRQPIEHLPEVQSPCKHLAAILRLNQSALFLLLAVCYTLPENPSIVHSSPRLSLQIYSVIRSHESCHLNSFLVTSSFALPSVITLNQDLLSSHFDDSNTPFFLRPAFSLIRHSLPCGTVQSFWCSFIYSETDCPL